MWNGDDESSVEPDAAGSGTAGAQTQAQSQKTPFPWERNPASTGSGQPPTSGSVQQRSGTGRQDDGDSITNAPQNVNDPLFLMARITVKISVMLWF